MKPDLVIGPLANPQTIRWHIFKWRGWQIAVHKWLRSDDDRALHDHSADNLSIILNGGYWEVLSHSWEPARVKFRWPLVPYFRIAETPHRIILPSDGKPVYTLWIRAPARRRWGFWCAKGWRDNRDYLNNRDYYAAGTSETGAGCG
jgi:hypothetical protein